MIAPQSPTLQVFIPIEPVLRADVPSQRLAPIATIEAHHVILMNGSPYRHCGNQNFLGRNGLSNLTDSSMDCDDEIGKLAGCDRMMTDVALDDLRGQMWIILFGIHDVLCSQFCRVLCTSEGI
jgi:hypothetical protein